MQDLIAYFIDRIDTRFFCGEKTCIPVSDSVFVGNKCEMSDIILRWISRIAIFHARELGDLFEFTSVPIIYQENIITVIVLINYCMAKTTAYYGTAEPITGQL